MIKILKLILFTSFAIYQTFAFSKTTLEIDFNPKYVSNYLSALISDNNHKSDDSLRYFNSSKILINKHDEFFKNYIITLTANGKVQKSINTIFDIVERLFLNILLRIEQGADSLLAKKSFSLKINRYNAIKKPIILSLIFNTISICFIFVAIFLRKQYGSL